MHVKSKRVFSAFDQITSYIDACEAFCLEIDPAVSTDVDMQTRMLIPNRQSLQSLLSAKEYQRLSRILSELGGPHIAKLNVIRPMNLISILSSLIMVEDTEMILDMSLFQYARQHDKRTFGIETKEEHFEILDAISLDLELKQLKSIIRHFASFKKMHHTMMNHYINGHIDKLYQQGKKSLGAWRRILLKDRNLKMAKRLAKLAERESIFCAVGAGHLYGKYGVLPLLKKEGLKIKPVQLLFS